MSEKKNHISHQNILVKELEDLELVEGLLNEIITNYPTDAQLSKKILLSALRDSLKAQSATSNLSGEKITLML